MSIQITFTPAASAYVKKMLAKKGGVGFRLSVKKTGCSGYSYLPTIVNDVNPVDMAVAIAPDMTIYVDATWQHLLQGVQVDYVEEHKGGIPQKKLVFTNPQESGRCGCGESFHLE